MGRSKALLVTALLLAAAAAWAQARALEAQGLQRRYSRPIARPLPREVDRSSLLGALGGRAILMSDIRYIECLQYIGDSRNRNDAQYSKALKLYGSLQWLDPGFTYAIREGISFLGWVVNRPRESALLTRRAMEADPRDERYASYWGALAYQDRLDQAGVVESLRSEVLRPDAPESLLRIVGHIYIKEQDWEGALTYWSWVQKRGKQYMTQEWARRSIARAKRELGKKGRP